MRLRRYRTEDLPILARLFGETVRQVNCRDYTLPQVEAWAAGEADLLTRDSWFQRLYTLVAEADGLVLLPEIFGSGPGDGGGEIRPEHEGISFPVKKFIEFLGRCGSHFPAEDVKKFKGRCLQIPVPEGNQHFMKLPLQRLFFLTFVVQCVADTIRGMK